MTVQPPEVTVVLDVPAWVTAALDAGNTFTISVDRTVNPPVATWTVAGGTPMHDRRPTGKAFLNDRTPWNPKPGSPPPPPPPPPVTPTVTSMSPTSGTTAGGTSVTLTGTNLASPTSVTFGGVAGTVTSSSSTRIVVTTPAEAAGEAVVVVTTAAGTASPPEAFDFQSPPPPPPGAPVITSMAPSSGPAAGGTHVVLTGTNLAPAETVTFGGVPGTITSDSSTSITVTSPAGAAGAVPVVVTTSVGSGSAPVEFDYTAAAAKVLVVVMENNGQTVYAPGQGNEFGELMGAYTYCGMLSLGHFSGSNYVDLYSGIDCHSPDLPPTPYSGTANPDYNSTIVNDGTDSSTFNSRTTIFDVLKAGSKSFVGYYDSGFTARRDPFNTFPRLSSLPVPQHVGTLTSLVTDATVGLDALDPDFAYAVPDDTNNGHNGAGAGESWLTSFVAAVQSTAWYAAGGTLLIVSDEDNGYGADSATAAWTPLGHGDARNGGAGGFVWAISVSRQTTAAGGHDLTSGSSYAITDPIGGDPVSAKTGTHVFEAGTTTAGILATILGALGLSASSLSTAAYAQTMAGLILPPSSGGGGGGMIPMPTSGFTLDAVTYTISASDDFPGTALNPANWYQFESATPGAGAKDSGGVPISTWPGTLTTVAGSVATMNAKLGPVNSNGNPTLEQGGLGSTGARAQTGPAAVDWAMRVVKDVNALVTYCLWWPNGTWPPNQEFDIYENGGFANSSHETVHGSPLHGTSDIAVGHVPTSYDFSSWTYCRAIWTTAAIQFWAGPDANHLTMLSEVTAAQLTAAGVEAPAAAPIDLTSHAWDMAVLLEGVSSIPGGFTTTPTPITEVDWVVWYAGS